MDLVADQHPDRGGAREPVRLHVPARGREQTVAGGDEANEVAGGGAGDEADGRLVRQAQRFEEPSLRDRLDGRPGRRGDLAVDGLVPGRDQPVGGQRRG